MCVYASVSFEIYCYKQRYFVTWISQNNALDINSYNSKLPYI